MSAEPVAAPRLVHRGIYSLYETPDGGRHLVYRRLESVDDAGQAREIDGAHDEHLPDIPPSAIPLIENFLQNGLPPAVLAMLDGKLSLRSVVKALNGASNGAD